MGSYSLSKKADFDLEKIYEYGILNFGLKRAKIYIIGLHERFEDLANSPGFGRCASQYALKLRRFEYKSHVIFYIITDTGVFIVRVLGVRMDFRQHI